MPLTPDLTFGGKAQTADLDEGKEAIAVVCVKGLEVLGRGTQGVAHGIVQLAGLCLVDAKSAGEGNGVVAAAAEGDDFCGSAQVERHAFSVEDAEVGVGLEEQIGQRLEEDGNVVEELLGKTRGRVLEQMRQLVLMRHKGFSWPVSQRLARAQVDVDAQLVDGGRQRGELYPRQREVGSAVRKGNVQFIAQPLRRHLVLDGLLELAIRLAAHAQQAPIAAQRQVMAHIDFRHDHDAAERLFQFFAKQHLVHMVAQLQRQIQKPRHRLAQRKSPQIATDADAFLTMRLATTTNPPVARVQGRGGPRERRKR